jgi:Ca-activated chloride channel homolog
MDVRHAMNDFLPSLLPGLGGFAWPWLLLALPLPWLARRLLPAARNASAALRVPYGARLDAIATLGGRARGGGIGWLAWLAWALLCIAAARPQQLGDVVQPPQSGRDMMLAVDLSGSMSEEDMLLGDVVVDRLAAAKAVLADFLDRRAGDRIGLLVFGQRAYALTPLTLDRDSVREQLVDSVVGLAGRETAIGDAIGLAVKRLRTQPAGQRVLILLTDGVNTAGMLDPLKAAELARDEQVRIHTIAFGGDGEGLSVFGFRVPMPGGADQEIDEAGLQRIATLTGGRAFRARDTEQLAGIYAEIDRLEPIDRPGQSVRPRVERYPWPLAASLACGLLAVAWPRRMAR